MGEFAGSVLLLLFVLGVLRRTAAAPGRAGPAAATLVLVSVGLQHSRSTAGGRRGPGGTAGVGGVLRRRHRRSARPPTGATENPRASSSTSASPRWTRGERRGGSPLPRRCSPSPNGGRTCGGATGSPSAAGSGSPTPANGRSWSSRPANSSAPTARRGSWSCPKPCGRGCGRPCPGGRPTSAGCCRAGRGGHLGAAAGPGGGDAVGRPHTNLTAVSGSNTDARGGGSSSWRRRGRGSGDGRGWWWPASGWWVSSCWPRPEPSVLRAAVMGGVGMAGLAAGRPTRGIPVVAAAGLVLLVADPWLAREFGFVLSVLATTALVLLARPWAERLTRAGVPRVVAYAVAVPVAAQAVAVPSVALVQPAVNVVSVPANNRRGAGRRPGHRPGPGRDVVSPVWPAGAAVVAWPAGWCAAWIAAVARFTAQAPTSVAVPPGRRGGARGRAADAPRPGRRRGRPALAARSRTPVAGAGRRARPVGGAPRAVRPAVG